MNSQIARISIFIFIFNVLFVVSCSDDSGVFDKDVELDADTDNISDDTDGDINVNDTETDNLNNNNNTISPIEGIYVLTGQDFHGNFEGQAELRSTGNGTFEFIQLQTWTDYTFESYKAALAWTASAVSSDQNSFTVTLILKTRNFITSYEDLSRITSDPFEITCSAEFTRQSHNSWQGDFTCDDPAVNFSETIIWNSENSDIPIWENKRTFISSHEPISQSEKDSLFQTYSTFHELPEVQPYVNRTEFNEAMHYFVYDPTDKDFYKLHPDTVRVIQSVPDKISLREARQRRDAYAFDLDEKQAIYENEIQSYFIDTLGMFADYNPDNPSYSYEPSGDGMLWTGVYVASQALKYLKTGDQNAFDNMLRSLNGQFICWEIMPEPGQFARTIRTHKTPVSGESWVRGSGSYSNIDYLPGANNDMLKGYFTSFPWVYLALKQAGGHQDVIDKMITISDDLVNNFEPAKDGRVNEMYLYMMLYMMDDNYVNRLEYKAKYQSFWQVVGNWINGGGGAEYNNGISDWSGNHLHIQSLLGLYVLTQEIGETDMHQDVKDGMKRALESMRYTRLGLFQLVTATLGDFSATPPELQEALEVLEEFPSPKSEFNYDWRINPDFCMSPFPRLPWKNDWTETDRTQSLYAYPLFEVNIDGFHFKSCPFNYKGGASGRLVGGIDFVFAYWFGKYFGSI